MKINIDRMAKLAGLSGSNSKTRSRSLNESKDMESMEEVIDDSMEEMIDDPMEEMIEVDEIELVQELRRAKKMMLASKRKRSKQNLQESQLQKIIEEEVENVFSELNLNSSWVYGSNQPRRSKKGYTHQGSFLKGIGFK